MSKKTVLMFLAIILVMLASSKKFFPKGHEIENVDTVQVIGFDKCNEDCSKVEVTFISKLDRSTSQTAGNVIVKTISGSGPTAFEAQRNIRAKTNKRSFMGYIDYVLIGEDAAKEDFAKYFDYFFRDHEARFSPKVFIVRGSSAKELINETVSGNIFIDDRLRTIIEGGELLGNTSAVSAIEVSGMLDKTDKATVIPALRQERTKTQKTLGEMPAMTIVPDGYAVIKEFKLVGYINGDSALGYNFLTNKVSSCPISIKDFTGEYVALEVIKTNTKVEAHFSGDKLESVTYKTSVLSAIPEQQSKEDITTEAALKGLRAEEAEYIKVRMEDVIKTSKLYGTDCIGLSEKISLQHPYKWEKIEKQWTEIYPQLKINVDVTCEISGSYDISLPNGYKERG